MEDGYQTAQDLFGDPHLVERYKGNRKKATTERSELFRMFLDRLNPPRIKKGLPLLTAGRLGYIFQGVPTSDLYYLKSVCEDAERRGGSFSKVFWARTRPTGRSTAYPLDIH